MGNLIQLNTDTLDEARVSASTACVTVKREIDEIVALAPTEVATPEQRADAVNVASMISEKLRDTERARKASLDPLTKFTRWINAQVKEALASGEISKRNILADVKTYDAEQKRIADAEEAAVRRRNEERERHLREEAAKAAARAAAAKTDAERKQATAQADQLQARATVAGDAFVPKAASAVGSEGEQYRRSVKAEVSVKAVAAAMLKGDARVPEDALIVNPAWLRKRTPSVDEFTSNEYNDTPGVKFTLEQSLVV